MNENQIAESIDAQPRPSLITSSKAHRLIVTNPDGKEFINLSVFVVVIVALLAPQLAILIAMIALYKGASVEVVQADTKEESKKKKKRDYSPHQQTEDYFEQEHELKNELSLED
jgi:hypothetical protein